MIGRDIAWSVSTVKVSDLIPFEKNPRKHTKEDLERLKRSIQEIGFHTPIHATLKNEIMGGHLRIKALKQLGIEKVFTSKPNVELTEEEFTRVLFEGNTHHGAFDIEIIEQEFHGVELEEYGVDAVTLKQLNASAPKPKKEIEDNGKFMCLLEFDTEAEQEAFYGEMTEKGLLCKLMS